MESPGKSGGHVIKVECPLGSWRRNQEKLLKAKVEFWASLGMWTRCGKIGAAVQVVASHPRPFSNQTTTMNHPVQMPIIHLPSRGGLLSLRLCSMHRVL